MGFRGIFLLLFTHRRNCPWWGIFDVSLTCLEMHSFSFLFPDLFSSQECLTSFSELKITQGLSKSPLKLAEIFIFHWQNLVNQWLEVCPWLTDKSPVHHSKKITHSKTVQQGCMMFPNKGVEWASMYKHLFLQAESLMKVFYNLTLDIQILFCFHYCAALYLCFSKLI